MYCVMADIAPSVYIPMIERQGAIHCVRMRMGADCAPAEYIKALRDKAMASFQIECWPFVYFDWKVQRFCWPKGTSVECAESIYVKTTGPACVSEELCRMKKMKVSVRSGSDQKSC